jgi:hypothetical protein
MDDAKKAIDAERMASYLDLNLKEDGTFRLKHGDAVVNFKLTQFGEHEVNENKILEVFKKIQIESDKNNKAAVGLIQDMAEHGRNVSLIKLNQDGKNEYDHFNGRLMFDVDFKAEYFTKDNQRSQFTLERVVSHELAHVGAEKTTEGRENKLSAADHTKYSNTATMGSPAERVQKIEMPAIAAENYVCKHIFGEGACGPERGSYARPPKLSSTDANPVEQLRSLSQYIQAMPEHMRGPYEALAVSFANAKNITVMESHADAEREAQRV